MNDNVIFGPQSVYVKKKSQEPQITCTLKHEAKLRH